MERWPFSMLPVTGQISKMPSFREADKWITLTPFFSSIISHYSSHLPGPCVPLDSVRKVITDTLKQQGFHPSSYLYVFSTYTECLSHLVLIYLSVNQ